MSLSESFSIICLPHADNIYPQCKPKVLQSNGILEVWIILLTYLSEMPSRMQKVLSCRTDRQALYRSCPRVKDCLHLRTSVHRMWYLCQEVPLQRHQHHQSTHEPRVPSNSPLFGQQLQATSAAYATARTGFGLGRNKRDWEEYRVEDTQWQAEAQSGSI